jgi:protein-disulfide isomerase
VGGLGALAAAACVPVRTVDLPPGAPATGAKRPELVVQEIGDYECPFCARVQPAVKQLLLSHGDRIALVWRDYPLRRHPNALSAAEAAREARAQLGDAGFWQFHDVLFRNQHALGPKDLLRFAEAFPMDQRRFARALELGIHRDAVLADKRQVDALKLQSFGTPAFIIGPDVFVGGYDYEELAGLVDAAL